MERTKAAMSAFGVCKAVKRAGEIIDSGHLGINAGGPGCRPHLRKSSPIAEPIKIIVILIGTASYYAPIIIIESNPAKRINRHNMLGNTFKKIDTNGPYYCYV